MGIKISPKHGLNATIPICFFCGNPKDEIALLGRLKGDAKAPEMGILDYQPCDACKEKFRQGILMVAVNDHPKDNRPPIQEGLYPTGNYVLATDGLVANLFPKETAEQVLKTRSCLVQDTFLEQLQEEYKKVMEEEADEDA